VDQDPLRNGYGVKDPYHGDRRFYRFPIKLFLCLFFRFGIHNFDLKASYKSLNPSISSFKTRVFEKDKIPLSRIIEGLIFHGSP